MDLGPEGPRRPCGARGRRRRPRGRLVGGRRSGGQVRVEIELAKLQRGADQRLGAGEVEGERAGRRGAIQGEGRVRKPAPAVRGCEPPLERGGPETARRRQPRPEPAGEPARRQRFSLEHAVGEEPPLHRDAAVIARGSVCAGEVEGKPRRLSGDDVRRRGEPAVELDPLAAPGQARFDVERSRQGVEAQPRVDGPDLVGGPRTRVAETHRPVLDQQLAEVEVL